MNPKRKKCSDFSFLLLLLVQTLEPYYNWQNTCIHRANNCRHHSMRRKRNWKIVLFFFLLFRYAILLKKETIFFLLIIRLYPLSVLYVVSGGASLFIFNIFSFVHFSVCECNCSGWANLTPNGKHGKYNNVIFIKIEIQIKFTIFDCMQILFFILFKFLFYFIFRSFFCRV